MKCEKTKGEAIKKRLPRILIGAGGSNGGKTTIVCAILKALMNREKKTAAFKCGPDYIDPMFHSRVIGTRSGNLDLYLCGEENVRLILGENGYDDGISVIEGAMGLYDGFDFEHDDYSANNIAMLTDTSEVLLVDVRGKSASILPAISGYLNYFDNNIKAVIFNRCSSGMYSAYKKTVEKNLGVEVIGHMPVLEGVNLESRHLGLVTAGEIENLSEITEKLGEAAEKYIDISRLIEIAEEAPPFEYIKHQVPRIAGETNVRLGLARDNAFSFYYEDNLNLLKAAGCDIIEFSPVAGDPLPKDLDGLYLGGGYPENYLKELSSNTALLADIKKAGEEGMPIFGECGGFMYLGKSINADGKKYSMTGLLSGESHMTDKLVRFGYKEMTALQDNVLSKKGEKIRCHEFHYSDSTEPGNTFSCINRRKKESFAGCTYKNVMAGYPHIHFFSNREFAYSFVRKCAQYRRQKSMM